MFTSKGAAKHPHERFSVYNVTVTGQAEVQPRLVKAKKHMTIIP